VWDEEEEEDAVLSGLSRSRISFMDKPPPDFCFNGLLNTDVKKLIKQRR
jgi:hypothetical protein